MTDQPLPEPLVPADVDLRDFQFMPVDVQRLLTSETWILGTGDERAAAMTLWLASWHQVPAGSIPNDDRMLAHLSQSGPKWKRIKAHVLRGWIVANNGRMYHPVVAEKALEAWIEKLAFSLSGATGNAKRWNVSIETEGIRERALIAIGMLRTLAPQSRTLKKKAVVLIESGSGGESPRDSGGDKKTSGGDDESGSGGDRGGTRVAIARDSKGTGTVKGQGYKEPTNTDGGNDTSPAVIGPMDAAALAAWLQSREQGRGKPCRDTAQSAQIVTLAAMHPTAEELDAVYAQAVSERLAKNDPSAVNAGFLASILSRHRGLAIAVTTASVPMSQTKRAILAVQELKEQYQ